MLEEVIGRSRALSAPNGMLIEVTRHFSDIAPYGRRLENER
jgi:hypothetical protein